MSTTLIQYDVYEEVREFLDEILLSFRREVVEEYEPEIAQVEGRSFPRQTGSAHIVEDEEISEDEERPQGMELIEEDRAGRG